MDFFFIYFFICDATFLQIIIYTGFHLNIVWEIFFKPICTKYFFKIVIEFYEVKKMQNDTTDFHFVPAFYISFIDNVISGLYKT